MFRTTIANAGQKRTLDAVYGYHQSTPQAFTLDPNWGRGLDIYPGMVMTKLAGEVVTLSDGAAATASYGLSAAFVAPALGIDEVTDSGIDGIGVWVGGSDAQFEILAPAWDNELPAAMYAEVPGQELLLVPGSGALNAGKLCPAVAVNYVGAGALAGHEVLAAADPIARLISVIDETTILIGFIDR